MHVYNKRPLRYTVRMKTFRLFFIAALVCVLSSCSGIIGYSVVLWNIQSEDVQIADGTIVPVYVKSNINQEYIIGIPDSKEKIEVPLWMLSVPDSKKNALKLAASYAEYEHQYAKCVFDGLPVRADKVNTSKQVYRLRKDEIVRALYEGEGQSVNTGSQSLEGVWLRVLTSDGTAGWCFSYNLRLFTMNADGTVGEGAEEADVQEIDQTLNAMLAEKWYPEYFGTMISKGNIDLDTLNASYGFDTGKDTGTVTLKLSDIDVSYPYAGAEKVAENIYKFTDMPIQVTVRSESVIVVQHTDSRGMPTSYVFTTLEDDVPQIIAEEKQRRDAEFNSLVKLGPDFRSSSYGSLSFASGYSFTWSDYKLLVPAIISRNANGQGTIQIKYFLPSSLKSEWGGVLTFKFEGMKNEVNFLYKKEADGLRLCSANVSVNTDLSSTDKMLVSKSSNAIVMYFRR